jgi:hypothetical protein
MDQVRSKDGTSIAYERLGDGPAVVLVGGAFVDRSENAPLAGALAEWFSVYNYDRRGRATAATPSRTPWNARSRIWMRWSPRPAGRPTCTASPRVVRWCWRRRRPGSRSTGWRCMRCRTTWPRTGRGGTGSTRPGSRGSWPRGVAGTRPSCSCGWPGRPTRWSPGPGARRCGRGWRRSPTPFPTTRPAWATTGRPPTGWRGQPGLVRGRRRRLLRQGRGRHRRQHPAGPAADRRGPDPHGRPQGARPGAATVLHRPGMST